MRLDLILGEARPGSKVMKCTGDTIRASTRMGLHANISINARNVVSLGMEHTFAARENRDSLHLRQ